MGIDTPSDELYTINTNQSGAPIYARHKLQPRLLRSNPNTKPTTFPKKPARQKWTGPIYLPGQIYKLLSQEAKNALQKYNVEAVQKYSQETYMKLHLYMMYMKIHRICETYVTHNVLVLSVQGEGGISPSISHQDAPYPSYHDTLLDLLSNKVQSHF